jgi:uncharacterized protein YdeI (YjbR/CyaY-like superfamily)
MAPVKVDPAKVHEFKDVESFYAWLGRHHETETEVWIKIHKLGSGLPSITPKQAIDAVLCWGWIDAVRKAFDDKSYLQRYTPRGRKSIWSQINIDNVARLVEEGRMTGHGLKQVEAAKADGRWDAAYAGQATATVPDDLRAALDASPKAAELFATLDGTNRYAIVYRIGSVKRADTRARKIAGFVADLERGVTPHPRKKT